MKLPALRHLASGLTIVLLSCIVLEVGARIVEARYLGISLGEPFFWLITDPYVGLRNDPAMNSRMALHFDKRGFQIVNDATAANSNTIVCLGDSGTFGIWSDGEKWHFDSYTKPLAGQLECTVVNTGTVGYTSWHCVRVLKEYKGPLDAVVVRVGWNDHAHGNPMELRNADSDVAAFLNNFATGRLLLFAAWQQQDPLQPATPIEEFKRNLVTISRIARDRAAPVFYVDYPVHLTEENVKRNPLYLATHRGVAQSIPELEAVHKEYIDATREIAINEKQHFVETPLSREYFSDEDAVHPNAEGARQTANYIAQALKSAKVPLANKLRSSNAQTPSR